MVRALNRYTSIALLTLTTICLSLAIVRGQEETKAPAQDKEAGYQFTDVKRIDCTPVTSQDRTGTCWCFATGSFLEAEAIRMGKGAHNLSEMFVVRNTYVNKVRNYILRQGKTNFGEGAMAHDLMSAVSEHGIVPEEVYSGLIGGEKKHDHGELESVLQAIAETYAKCRAPSANWHPVVDAVLDIYLGKAPSEFSYRGVTYTPASFAEYLGFKKENYIDITSYTHHPFGESFTLEVPDDFSGGPFLNVPIDDLIATIDRAIENGYSVAWDGDVSEKGFIMGNGIAVLPADDNHDFANKPGAEMTVTQEMRQKTFEDFSTGEEHLMHLVGIAKDQNGAKYYIIKNSWGEIGSQKGYLYMSEAYARLKTVAITVHRDVWKMGAGKTATKTETKPTATQIGG